MSFLPMYQRLSSWRICCSGSSIYWSHKLCNKIETNAQRWELSRCTNKRYEVWECSIRRGENIGSALNKLWAYSYRNLASKTKQPGKPNNPEKKCQCCEMKFTIGHMKQYKVINVKCSNCKKVGCFAKACQ